MTSALLGIILGALLGYHYYQIKKALTSIKSSLLEKEKTQPTVVSGNPALARPERSSAVISPKSPQLIDFEENEELRKMNL